MSATTSPPRSDRGPTIPLGRQRWVTIRPIESSDADGLFAFYAALSPRTRYARFLAICPGIDASVALRFAGVDHRTRDGFVAVLRVGSPSDGSIVGHVCMEPAGHGIEEVAFVVADELQGRGIGTALMQAAVESARRRGIRSLVGTTFATNIPMRRLAFGSGSDVTVRLGAAGVEEFTIDLAA